MADKETLWNDSQIKHLELLQAVIARMAHNSANTKNYCLTITAAIISVSATKNAPIVLWCMVPLTIIFAILVASYFKLERAFRNSYNQKRVKVPSDPVQYEISPTHSDGPKFKDGQSDTSLSSTKFTAVAFSWTVGWFYSALVLIVIIAAIFLSST